MKINIQDCMDCIYCGLVLTKIEYRSGSIRCKYADKFYEVKDGYVIIKDGVCKMTLKNEDNNGTN